MKIRLPRPLGSPWKWRSFSFRILRIHPYSSQVLMNINLSICSDPLPLDYTPVLEKSLFPSASFADERQRHTEYHTTPMISSTMHPLCLFQPGTSSAGRQAIDIPFAQAVPCIRDTNGARVRIH